jgi:hypothetical protein
MDEFPEPGLTSRVVLYLIVSLLALAAGVAAVVVAIVLVKSAL